MSVFAALLVGLVAVGVPAVVIAFVWLTTRPPTPSAGPSSMDLGPEPPAIVDLLTGGFAVEDDAVPATAVDLASRRWLDIEETGGAVRLRLRTGRDELTTYEQRVLRHVESKASDGVAPAAVLTLGPEGASERWWKGFVREVNRHGRDLGLCRRRYHVRHIVAVWAAVAVGWLGTAAMGFRWRGWDQDRTLDSTVGLVTTVAGLGVLGMSFLAGRITRSDAQAETEAGLAAASRWLGVREHLAASGSFEQAPAASVAIWERNLAYATALGLAPVVLRQLPFETEHDRQAWSHVTGRWRRVKVRYLALRPAWGQAPWSTAFVGLIQAAFMGFFAVGAFMLADDRFDLLSLPDSSQRTVRLVALAVCGIAGVGVAFAATKVVLGVADLFRRRVVEGEVVRRRKLRTGHRLPKVVQWLIWSRRDQNGMQRDHRRRTRYHLAVDDGTRDSIVAHQVRSKIFAQAPQGSRVRMKVSPLLGYVSEIEMLSPPSRSAEAPVAHELVENLTGNAGAAMGAVFGRLAEVGEHSPEVRAAMQEAMDERDEEGRTQRERLDEARQQMQRVGGAASTRDSAGDSLIGGLLGGLSEAMGQFTGEQPNPEGRSDGSPDDRATGARGNGDDPDADDPDADR